MLCTIFRLFTFFLLFLGLADGSEAKNGWIEYENKFYFKIFREKADFFDAEMNCRKHFSHLASYDGIDDFTFIRGFMKDTGLTSQKCWLGLYNQNESADERFYKFYFTDGTEFDSAAWRKSFPLYSEQENTGVGHSQKPSSQPFLQTNGNIFCSRLLIHDSHISSVSIVRMDCSQRLPAHVCKVTAENFEAHRAELESMDLPTTTTTSSTATEMSRYSTFSTVTKVGPVHPHKMESKKPIINRTSQATTVVEPFPVSSTPTIISANVVPYAWVASNSSKDAQSASSTVNDDDCSPSRPQACSRTCGENDNLLARLYCSTGNTNTVIVLMILSLLVIVTCLSLMFCCYKHTRERDVYWLNRNKENSISEATDLKAEVPQKFV